MMSTDPTTTNDGPKHFHSAVKDALNELRSSPSEPEPSSTEKPLIDFVVGIGASAGGLQSIEKLLTDISPKTNSAFVIVQHFSPDFESSMPEILARSTNLELVMAEDGTALEPDKIFLIPPGQEIRITSGRFQVKEADRTQATKVVDILFQSLAASRGPQTIGVILSGTGSDGSEGIRAIRNAGGSTLVESYESAQFDGMPRNAVQTRCVDHLLSIADIASWLNQRFEHPDGQPILESSVNAEELTGIELIFALLTERHEVDFSAYKPSTVARRIARRQQICKKKKIQDYAEYAKENTKELDLLYHDLLIGVTKFFRDTDAFLSLEQCLTELIRTIPEDNQLRIWSAGCATGEESYSLAMLAYDAFSRLGRAPNFKVFATDIHQGSLDFASRGVYDNDTMEYVSHERQSLFFSKESPIHSRVNNLLRRNMVFARHNVFGDPPFTNMHLVTCRNLLIYLKNDAQMRAISSFHFSLKVDGLMMLGSSETVGPLAHEFRHIDKGWRIFQKIANRPNLMNQLLDEKNARPARGARQLVNILNRDRPESMSFTRLIECYDMILREYVHSGVLLDNKRDVLHAFGDAGKYLNNTAGKFSGNFTDLLDGPAKVSITAALIRSQKKLKQKVILAGIEMKVGDTTEIVDVTVRSIDSADSDQSLAWLVEFAHADQKTTEASAAAIKVDMSSNSADDLESELIYTRDTLNISIQQLESSNQELSAANEELVASNEELQSTNEELESVNEELYTVNMENNRRIDELKEVTDDLEVLLENNDIGTLFLDTNLCIRRFTHSITEYFDLLSHDIGRPIDNFTNKSGIDQLDEKLTDVLGTGRPQTSQFTNKEGKQVRCKILPHMVDDLITGVVLTISVHPNLANETQPMGYWRWSDTSDDEIWWCDNCCDLLGYESDEMTRSFSILQSLVHPDDQHKITPDVNKTCELARTGMTVLRIKCKDGIDREFQIQGATESNKNHEFSRMCGSIVPVSSS